MTPTPLPASGSAPAIWAATDFEFRHRASLIGALLALAFAGSWLAGGASTGDLLARALGGGGETSPAAWARHLVFAGAAALVAAGAALRTWGTAYLHVETMMDARLHTRRLIITGPYRHVRNPLYLGNLLVLAGVGLWAHPIGLAVLWLGSLACFYRLILREEAFLRAQHGPAFAAFQAVPRLWPALRPRPGDDTAAPRSPPRWLPALGGEVVMWAGAAALAVYACSFNGIAAGLVAGAGAALSGLRLLAVRRAAADT